MAGLQGRVFAGYQLTDQLGSVGIAEVYRARPANPGGREAVVKVIHPEFVRQPGFLPHFRQIVQMTSKLASHPHILPLLASGEEAGYLFLITPYVAAGTLNDWLARGGKMGPADIGPFFRQLCEALGYAHSLGVAHGNVKPSNVFLYEGRHVMLGDFGLLWDVAHMDILQAGSGGDALEYMAPEIAQGMPATPSSDIYSAGAVLFATVAGHAPFRAARPADVLAAHAQQPVPHLAQVNPTLPPPLMALDAVTQKAMAKPAEQRFPSAAALAQAIEGTIRQAAQAGPLGLPAPMGQGPQAVYTPPQLSAPPPGATPQWAAPGASASAIPPLGAGLGHAAAALFNAPPASNTYEPQGASIRPGGQQFPPLPASATVDESMDQGGAMLRQPDVFAPGGASSLPYEPTNRMPAQSYNPPSYNPPAYNAPADAPAAYDGGWDAQGEAPADSFRGPLQVGRPRGGLGRRLGQAGGPLPLDDPQMQADMGDGYDGMSLPAVNGSMAGAFPPAQGFSISGGGAGQWDEPANGGAFGGQPLSESQELQAWMASGEPVAPVGESGPVRSFSPTQLGLPRLTSPELGSMPPSWQELINTPAPSAEDARRWPSNGNGANGATHTPWRSNPNGALDEWSDSAGGWTGPNSGPVGWPDASAQMSIQGGAVQNMASWDDVNKIPREDDLHFDTGIAKKSKLRVRGKRGLAPRLILVLVLLSIFDIGAVIVARPDLCPISACVTLSNKVHQALPFLGGKPSVTPPAISAAPTKVQITVAAEKSSNAPLALTNGTNASIDWQASAKLPWLTIAPASGTLGVGSSVNLTVTAKATGIKAGSYTDTITVSTAQGNISIPVTITVS